ncbi:MAG: hypothetical protein E7623_00550 [Ruminococcaceae bacterium]|nr:hypothetical protein [Oscillospiraceae bacterium]
MYSKNYHEQRRGYSDRTSDRTGVSASLPPNYGGVAAYSSADRSEAKQREETGNERDPRFPLMYEGSQNDGYERDLGSRERDTPQKREGIISGLSSKSINAEDLLLAALILLLINSGADDDILLLLGLLLILGL